MSTKDGKNKNITKSIAPDTEKMGRRDFFMTAGKLILPTIGIVGLSLSAGSRAQAADCTGNCTGTCTGCEGGCWSCVGTCDATCEGINKGMVK